MGTIIKCLEFIKKHTKKIKSTLVLITIIFTAFLIGKCSAPSHQSANQDTITRTDTITRSDTIFIKAPTPNDTKRTRQIAATFPRAHTSTGKAASKNTTPGESGSYHLTNAADTTEEETEPPDSIEVLIPIEQKHYQAEEYEAWVSGWTPSLDSLKVYKKTEYINTTIETTRWKTRHWGISIGVGATVTTKGRIEPGFFIGATYTFLTF